jgi:hypothetical protein
MADDGEELPETLKEGIISILDIGKVPKGKVFLDNLSETGILDEGASKELSEDPEIKKYMEELTSRGFAYGSEKPFGLTPGSKEIISSLLYLSDRAPVAKVIFSMPELARTFCEIYDRGQEGIDLSGYRSLFEEYGGNLLDKSSYKEQIPDDPSMRLIEKIPMGVFKSFATIAIADWFLETNLVVEKEGRYYISKLGGALFEMYCLSRGYKDFSFGFEDYSDGDNVRAAVDLFKGNGYCFTE